MQITNYFWVKFTVHKKWTDRVELTKNLATVRVVHFLAKLFKKFCYQKHLITLLIFVERLESGLLSQQVRLTAKKLKPH